MHGITGAEVTLKGGFHLTLLAKDRTGILFPLGHSSPQFRNFRSKFSQFLILV
jgi:hypothetical protein